MRISIILFLLLFVCQFLMLSGVHRPRHRRLATTKRPLRFFHRHARQAFRGPVRHGSGTVGQQRTTRAFPTTRAQNQRVTLRPTFRANFAPATTRRAAPSRLQAPPRQTFVQNNRASAGPPGIRPPKGIADRLNRARLKDFMSLGAFLLRRQRV